MSARLAPSFFARDGLETAPALLGKVLCHRLEDGTVLRVRIGETELYYGESDTACHARAGKTARTAMMYRPGGFAYVYLCYGIHSLLNIVTGPEGHPQAVLIRAGEWLEPPPLRALGGPGILTKAMRVTHAHNGLDLRDSSLLWLEDETTHPFTGTQNKGSRPYACHTRIGVGYASAQDQAKLWRFVSES